MLTVSWEHFHHVADIGVRGFGATMAEAFEQAALAMTAVISAPAGIVPREKIELEVAAADPEFLLTEWLDALIYEMAVRRMLFSRFQVEISGDRLHGRAWGEAVDRDRHQPVEIKGATFTQLRVVQLVDGQWLAQCVVDV